MPIGLGFVSHWLTKWPELQSDVKQNQNKRQSLEKRFKKMPNFLLLKTSAQHTVLRLQKTKKQQKKITYSVEKGLSPHTSIARSTKVNQPFNTRTLWPFLARLTKLEIISKRDTERSKFIKCVALSSEIYTVSILT